MKDVIPKVFDGTTGVHPQCIAILFMNPQKYSNSYVFSAHDDSGDIVHTNLGESGGLEWHPHYFPKRRSWCIHQWISSAFEGGARTLEKPTSHSYQFMFHPLRLCRSRDCRYPGFALPRGSTNWVLRSLFSKFTTPVRSVKRVPSSGSPCWTKETMSEVRHECLILDSLSLRVHLQTIASCIADPKYSWVRNLSFSPALLLTPKL